MDEIQNEVIEQNEAQAAQQPQNQEALSALLREEVRAQVDAALQTAVERLDARQAELNKQAEALEGRALKISCEEALKQRGLPPELAEALTVQSEDAVETVVNALEKAFRAAVQQGVEQRLAGDTPNDTLPFQDVRDLTDEEYYDFISSH